MKRFTHILAAVALVVVFATSQAFAQDLRAGAKVGFGFSNFGGDTQELFGVKPDSKTGFAVGAFFGIDLHKYFRLQLDGQYVQKGGKFTEEGVDVKAKVDYFEFLVPFTLTIPTEGSVTPRLFAGPAIAFESSCKLSGEEGGISVDVDCSTAGVESKSTDFGIFFGGGIDLAVGPGALMFDVLYNLGMSNINDVPEADQYELKNKNIQILVGYAFLFGGM
jgi:hypothetical protein